MNYTTVEFYSVSGDSCNRRLSVRELVIILDPVQEQQEIEITASVQVVDVESECVCSPFLTGVPGFDLVKG